MIAPLGIAGIRERVGHQPSESAFINDQVDILEEIGRRRAAMAPEAVQLARLDDFEDRFEVSDSHPVDPLGVDHGSVGEDLKKHTELAAVVGASQGESGEDGIGRGDRRGNSRLGGKPLGRAGRSRRGRCFR
jgi:hypothetical protein